MFKWAKEMTTLLDLKTEAFGLTSKFMKGQNQALDL